MAYYDECDYAMATLEEEKKMSKVILPKRYKRFFENAPIILRYRQRRVFDTNHSIARFNERFPKLHISEYERILRDGIDTILDVFKDKSAKYIVTSRSKDVAIQLEWRRDSHEPDDKTNQGFTATTLNIHDHDKILKQDTKFFVELLMRDYPNLYESENHVIDTTGYIQEELEEGSGLKVSMHFGKIGKNFEIIEVE